VPALELGEPARRTSLGPEPAIPRPDREQRVEQLGGLAGALGERYRQKSQISEGGSIPVYRMAGIGATLSLPRVPAKVS